MNRFFTVLAIIVTAMPCLAFSSSELSWFEADFVSRSLVQGSLRIDDSMIPIPINCKLNQARNAGPFSGRCSRTLKSGVEFTWFVANRLIVRSEGTTYFTRPGLYLDGHTVSGADAVFDLRAGKRICQLMGFSDFNEYKTFQYENTDSFVEVMKGDLKYAQRQWAPSLYWENSESTRKEAYWPRDYFGFQMVRSDKFPEVYKAHKEKQPGFFASLFGSAYFRGRSDPNSYEISSVVDGVEISPSYSKPIISKTTVVSVNRDGEFGFKQDSPFVSTLACDK